MPMTGPRIAIIGAGFSGSLLAVQLLRRFLPQGRVYLIEKNEKFGRGLAYSTENPGHLLNVRAGRMSAFVDDPDHFVTWLRQRAKLETSRGGGPIASDGFVSRRLYGTYIQDLLGEEVAQTGRGGNLFLVPDEAVALQPRPGGLVLEVRGGRRYEAEIAVLAIGNFPHDNVAAHYYGNPWSPHALAGLEPDAPVLLTGTALTMVDTVISLLDRRHRGPIHARSRHGLLPRRHGPTPAVRPLRLSAVDTSSVVELLSAVRRAVRSNDDAAAWRTVVDELRPFTQPLWQGLPEAEKRRFMRHLRPWWDAHRHRMAPAVADIIDGAERSGRLRVQAGRILGMTPDRSGVDITLRGRSAAQTERLRVARVIDCSGPQCDYARIDSPLVRSLLAQGLARADPLGLGLDVTLDSAVLDRRGIASSRLFALGPVTRGVFWEITSVPDIREQCWKLASRLGLRLAARRAAAG